MGPHPRLEVFPEAFVHVQEYALVPFSEKPAEAIHIKTKLAHIRKMKYVGPALTAATQRRDEIEEMLRDDMDWVVAQWTCRTMFIQLLEHVKTKHQISLLSLPQREALLYCFASTIHFRQETEFEQRHVKALALAEERAQSRPAILLTDSIRVVLDFLKSMMSKGSIFGVFGITGKI